MRKLFFAALVLAGSLFVALQLPASNTSAATVTGYVRAFANGTGYTITNQAQANTFLATICSSPSYPHPVAVVAFPTNMEFIEATGTLIYTPNVVWQSCAGKGDTRAFAVLGYPTVGGQVATCPNAGTYAYESGTYDCIKYTNSDLGHLAGFAALNCLAGTGYTCVTGGSNPAGVFRSVIERIALQPSTSPSMATQPARSGTIPNWSTYRQTNTSYGGFGRDNAFCTYYKWNSNGASGYGNCVNIAFNVTWEHPWEIRGESYLKTVPGTGQTRYQGTQALTATPGQTVYWDHDLRNEGPGNMPDDVTININRTDFSLATGTEVSQIYSPAGELAKGDATNLFYVNNNISHLITQDDVGERLCQRIEWTPGSSSSAAMQHSSTQAPNLVAPGTQDWTCVSVPFNYTLVPRIDDTISIGQVVDSNSTPLTVSGTVLNQGPTKSRTDVAWQITQVEYSVPLTDIPRIEGGPGGAPCAYFIGSTGCSPRASGNEASGYSFLGSGTYEGIANLANKPAGTKICFALSVQKYNATATDWQHSPLRCIVVGKKPKVQVLSGDLLVGRGSATNDLRESNVVTSTSTDTLGGVERYFGSWAEYAIVPTGCVTGMASGAGYAAGGATTSVLSSLSVLTFTNPSSTSCPHSIGRYTQKSVAPNVASRFPINVTAANATPGNSADPSVLPASSAASPVTLSALSRAYQAPAGATQIYVTGGIDIAPGQWVVVNAQEATVTITGNIRYTGAPLHNLGEIPQVVIIAKNIIIEDDVTQIDAWLVATGSDADGIVNTCGGGGVAPTTPLTVGICNSQLVVNGPVIANHLQLRRTHGAEAGDLGRPAEVFNLRADAYLWATHYNLSTGRLSTAETKELPPRF